MAALQSSAKRRSASLMKFVAAVATRASNRWGGFRNLNFAHPFPCLFEYQLHSDELAACRLEHTRWTWYYSIRHKWHIRWSTGRLKTLTLDLISPKWQYWRLAATCAGCALLTRVKKSWSILMYLFRATLICSFAHPFTGNVIWMSEWAGHPLDPLVKRDSIIEIACLQLVSSNDYLSLANAIWPHGATYFVS